MAEKEVMPVDDDFDFNLDLTETEMLWEKKIEEITNQAATSHSIDTDQNIDRKHVSADDNEDLPDEETNKNENCAEKMADIDGIEDLEEVDKRESSQSPSLLDSQDGSAATRENSLNALRDSLNAFRDAIDVVRQTMMNDDKLGEDNVKEANKNTATMSEGTKTDGANVNTHDGKERMIDTLDEEKAVIVSFYDTIDLTDQGDIPSPGDEMNTSSSGTMGEEEMNSFVVSSTSKPKPKSDIRALAKQIREESKPVSMTTQQDDMFSNPDTPMCQSCLKAKEKRNCTHRHHPYPPTLGQGQVSSSTGGQGNLRGIGRGALLEQLTKLGVKPTSRSRGITSSDIGGIEAVKKESKKLKYGGEVQQVREIFPAVHRHFVKKLLKYLANRFDSDKETMLLHAVTFLSENSYPMDGDPQWEIDAAIDSLKKVVITPSGIDTNRRKEPKARGERDNFVSNWITQSDFKHTLDTGGSNTSSNSNGNSDSGASDAASSGSNSRLFGFSNPETLTLGLPIVPLGTSVRSLGTSIASIADSPPASPLSVRDSSEESSVGSLGNSPNRTSEVIGLASDTSPDSVKFTLTGANFTDKGCDGDKKRTSIEQTMFKNAFAESGNKSSPNETTDLAGLRKHVKDFFESSQTSEENVTESSKSLEKTLVQEIYRRNVCESGHALEKYSLQEKCKSDVKQESSEMEIDPSELPAVHPKSTDCFREKLKKDQEQFKIALANYKQLEARKKASNKQNQLNKDGGKALSSSSLVKDGSVLTGDVRSKVTVTESSGRSSPRYHPYPQVEKHLSEDKKNRSTPEFSFAVPLAGNQPDSVYHGQTVCHPDISSSIKDEDMYFDDISVTSSSINCENCKDSHPLTYLGQCCDGHLLCKACLEKAAKFILVGNQSGQVICPVPDCGSSIPRSELRKSLHSIMLDLLDEKWNKEAVDAMNEMEDFVRCPDCGYSVILDLNIKQHCCEQCKKKFCRFCNLHWNVKNHDFCIKMKTVKTADGQGVITVPAHWSSTTNQEEPFQKVSVDKSEVEFTSVAELFYASMTRNQFIIEKVYRIQNQRLWEKYMLMRTHMLADLGEMHINEQRLFHGTSTEVIPAICKEGFDWRLHGRNGTAYGQGTYFARDANYSHQYSFKKGPYARIGSRHAGLHNHILNLIAHGSPHVLVSIPASHQSAGFQFGGSNTTTGNQQQSSGFQFGGPSSGSGQQQSAGFQFGSSNTGTGNQQQSSGFQFGGPSSGSGQQQSAGFQFGSSNTGTGNQQQSTGASSTTGLNFGSNYFLGPRSNTGSHSGFTFGTGSISSGAFGDDDGMADSSGNLMFIGRVLVGRICRGSSDMRRPPKDEHDPQQRLCHTAVNNINKPSIYVVFDSSQCYPEYLIEYRSANDNF